ncbi:MAG: hypothetical protein V1740_03415 [Candidatus Woesearchaeota archaeon]
MPKNKAETIKKFIGIASNKIVYRILIRTELEEDLRKYYTKEAKRDIEVSIKYRN